MPPGGATWCCRSRSRPPPRAPTAIIVEVHPNPDEAVCDGPQALLADTFDEYASRRARTAEFAGKALSAA